MIKEKSETKKEGRLLKDRKSLEKGRLLEKRRSLEEGRLLKFLMKHKILRYLVSGVTATVADYAVYEVLILTILQDVDKAWIALVISGVVSTFVAYFLHNNLTWRERDPGKYGVVKFFAWNGLMMILLRPALSTLFDQFTGLYSWAYGVCQWIGLPFSYDFVASTGLFVLLTIVTMTLNYICYDRVVFGKKSK